MRPEEISLFAKMLRTYMKKLRLEKSYSKEGEYLLEKAAELLFGNIEEEIKNKDNINCILAYYPIRGEIPLLPLYERLISSYRIFFPVTREELVFYEVDDVSDKSFVPGKMQIPEPKEKKKRFQDGDMAVAIVPGLCFSKETKDRIGYGGGYYDRFLAAHPSVYKIGACFEFSIYENLEDLAADGEIKAILLSDFPRHSKDVSMDCIITEKDRTI